MPPAHSMLSVIVYGDIAFLHWLDDTTGTARDSLTPCHTQGDKTSSFQQMFIAFHNQNNMNVIFVLLH